MCSGCLATDLVGAQMRLQETLERVWALGENPGLGVWVRDQLRAAVMEALETEDPGAVPGLIAEVFV